MGNAIKVAQRAVQSGLIAEIQTQVAPLLAGSPAAQKRNDSPLE